MEFLVPLRESAETLLVKGQAVGSLEEFVQIVSFTFLSSPVIRANVKIKWDINLRSCLQTQVKRMEFGAGIK